MPENVPEVERERREAGDPERDEAKYLEKRPLKKAVTSNWGLGMMPAFRYRQSRRLYLQKITHTHAHLTLPYFFASIVLYCACFNTCLHADCINT